MSIGFVLLAHENPEILKPLLQALVQSGSNVYIHYDLNSKYDLQASCSKWDFTALGSGKLFFASRIRVKWGEWSIVQATLNALGIAKIKDYPDDYYILLSGSCMPTKPLLYIEEILARDCKDHIEFADGWNTSWVTDGIQSARWTKYHFINWRVHPKLFALSLKVQTKLHINRKLPFNLYPYIGSQWWCLRRSTISKILGLLDAHPKVVKFFRKTWVPDELFFQTLVANLIPHNEIIDSPITYYKFNYLGIPRIFYDDSFYFLVNNNHLLARKISHNAKLLKKNLGKVFLMSKDKFFEIRRDEKKNTKLIINSKLHSPLFLPDDPYDVVKKIHNKIYIICTDNVQFKEYLFNSISKEKEYYCFGYLLNKDPIDFGNGINELAGYRVNQPKLAHHKWYFFFYDMVRLARGRNILFFVNTNSLNYLEYFKYRHNVTIVLLEERIGECNDDIFTYLTTPRIAENQAFNKRVQSMLTDASCTIKTLSIDMNHNLYEGFHDTDSCAHT